MSQEIDWIAVTKTIAIIIPVLGVFIEIVPVKFNPISWLLKYIGSRFNKDLKDDIKDIKKDIQELDLKVDQNEISRLRQEILTFSNSCQQGIKHSKDEFKHIIECNIKYHKILEARDMENGQIDVEYEYIMKVYNKYIEEHKFNP